MCVALLLPSLALADERPSDKPNTVFLPLTLQSHISPLVSSSPLPPTPTEPITPTDPTPTPVTPADPTPAPAAVVLTPFEAEVVRLTNAVRAQYNCPALNVSPELTIAARAYSQAMANNNFFSAADPAEMGDRLKAAGYPWMWAGENVQAGLNTPKAVVDYWVSLPEQRDIILKCEYKDIGVGFVDDTADAFPSAATPYRYYWTQDFGTRP